MKFDVYIDGVLTATFDSEKKAQDFIDKEKFKDRQKYSFDLAFASSYGRLPNKNDYRMYEK